MMPHLDQPDITLKALEIWVHGHQYPEALDYWDGNWPRATARCQFPGATVNVFGAFPHLPELFAWRASCRRLHETLVGEANLDTKEPELKVTMSGDGFGHVGVDVDIMPDHLAQQHHFQFGISQTYLPGLIKQLDRILAKYPVREAQTQPGTGNVGKEEW